MKKLLIKIVPLMVVMLFVIAMIATSNAATGGASLIASKTKVEPGDTFTVTFRANSDDGLNGIQGVLGYDKDKLELVGKPVCAEDWAEFGGEVSGGFACSYGLQSWDDDGSSDAEFPKSVDLYKFTFKAKSDASGTAKVSVSNIIIETESDDVIRSEKVEIEIAINNGGEEPPVGEKTLTSIQIATPPTKTSYTEGETFDKTGMKVIATYSDGSTKEITDYTVSPSGKLKKTDTKVTISYETAEPIEQKITVKAASGGNNNNNNNNNDKNNAQKNGAIVNGDKTVSDKDALPKTGASVVVIPMVIIAMVAVGSFFKYKNTEI